MKRLLTIITLCLFVLCGLQAQTIQNGSKWWDGSVLYTASVDASGEVTMNGVDAHEGIHDLMVDRLRIPGQEDVTVAVRIGGDGAAGRHGLRFRPGKRRDQKK